MKNRYFAIILLRIMLIHKRIAFLHNMKLIVQQINTMQNVSEIGTLGRLSRFQYKMYFPLRARMLINTNLLILIKDVSILHIIAAVFHRRMIRKQMKMNLLNLLTFSTIGYKPE